LLSAKNTQILVEFDQLLANVALDLKDHFDILDYDFTTEINGDLVKYTITLVLKVRTIQCIYHDAIAETCSDTENEREFDKCIIELIDEYDAEYSVKPFELAYKDTTVTIKNDTYIDDNSVKRCYYDALIFTYNNQFNIDYVKELLNSREKQDRFVNQLTSELRLLISHYYDVFKCLYD